MNLTQLPEKLPGPFDDGAADHLESKQLPSFPFPATNGETINARNLSGLVVLYVYPMTGRPDTPLPDDWDEIPGARGCTPQSCSFRDHYSDLQNYNACVYGLSAQSSEYQREVKERLHLPFELLSDSSLELKDALNLPTFETAGMELYKRITLIARDGIIDKVFYPVFPPSSNADEVVKWMQLYA
jgi:peroxiredoxin